MSHLYPCSSVRAAMRAHVDAPSGPVRALSTRQRAAPSKGRWGGVATTRRDAASAFPLCHAGGCAACLALRAAWAARPFGAPPGPPLERSETHCRCRSQLACSTLRRSSTRARCGGMTIGLFSPRARPAALEGPRRRRPVLPPEPWLLSWSEDRRRHLGHYLWRAAASARRGWLSARYVRLVRYLRCLAHAVRRGVGEVQCGRPAPCLSW